jgi:hypothetical protein
VLERISRDSPLEGEGFEPSVPRQQDLRKHRDRPRSVPPPAWRKLSPSRERNCRSDRTGDLEKRSPSLEGPLVRIHLPPTESRQRTILPSQAIGCTAPISFSNGSRAAARWKTPTSNSAPCLLQLDYYRLARRRLKRSTPSPARWTLQTAIYAPAEAAGALRYGFSAPHLVRRQSLTASTRYGVGASVRSRPSCFSSSQSADGIM